MRYGIALDIGTSGLRCQAIDLDTKETVGINGYSIAVADGAAHDAVIRLPLFSLLVGQHEEASGCIADAFPACTCVGHTIGSIQRSVGMTCAEGGAGLGGLLIQIIIQRGLVVLHGGNTDTHIAAACPSLQ